MQYVGSKGRHAKYILPIILKDRIPGSLYVEPFVGGANCIDKVGGRRLGADIDENVICLLSAVRDGWEPPESLSEDEYKALKAEDSVSPKRSFAGFLCSFGSKWFGGYARSSDGKSYPAIARRSLKRQAPNLAGIEFIHSDYRDLCIEDGSTVYCDPPYKGVTGYSSGKFDHDSFWEWTRETSKRCNVFVSEYEAPEDFVCVWERATTSNIDSRGSNFLRTEKLFLHESRSL